MGFDDQFRDVEAKAKVGTVLRRVTDFLASRPGLED